MGLGWLARLPTFYGVILRKRSRREEEQHERRQGFDVTLSSIGDAVITTDTHDRVTFLNPVAEKATGWKTDEAAGQPLEKVFNIINEKRRLPANNPVAKVLREGKIVGLANHTTLLSRDGSELPIEDSAAPIKDLSGNTLGVVMVFHDVMARRQAEQQREMLSKFPDENPHPVLRLSREGIIMYANAASQQVLSEWQCKVGEPAPVSWRDKVTEAITTASKTMPDAPCGRRVFSFVIAPILEGGYVNLYAMDVTERKRTEEERRIALEFLRLCKREDGNSPTEYAPQLHSLRINLDAKRLVCG